MVMMNNGPFFPTWLKKRLFVVLPRRPAPVAARGARWRTSGTAHRVRDPGRAAAREPAARCDHVGDARRDGGLPRLHRDQQPERHADRVEHPDDLRRHRSCSASIPEASIARDRRDAAARSRSCCSALFVVPALRQPRAVARLVPARDALLRRQLGLQHLAVPQGQRSRKLDKLDEGRRHHARAAREAAARPDARSTWRSRCRSRTASCTSRAGRCSRRCRARSTTSTTTSGSTARCSAAWCSAGTSATDT